MPFEGTLGGSMGCDVCVPYKRVHMRSAFFWVEGEALHLVPLHKDGFLAEGRIGEDVTHTVRVMLNAPLTIPYTQPLEVRGEGVVGADEPYVTRARRSKAGQGRGDGLGAPTRGAIRREKKRMNYSEADETERASAAQKDKKMQR